MKRRPLSIKEMWQDYEVKVISPEANAHERHERRKTFYCAVFAMLGELHSLGAPEYTETEGAAYLDSLNKEGQVFLQEMKNEVELKLKRGN